MPSSPVQVPRLWPNSVIVCLASGPSLNESDCHAVRGRARIIAVNDAIRLAPFADVLYSSDHRWWRHYRGVPDFDGIKYSVRTQRANNLPPYRSTDIAYLHNAGMRGLSTDPSALCTGGNSGHAAVNLAVHFGAKRIILLGYDMCVRGGKSHFFGEHPQHLRQRPSWELYIKLFATMLEPLRGLGIELLNCSRRTALTVPRADLEDVLQTCSEVAA